MEAREWGSPGKEEPRSFPLPPLTFRTHSPLWGQLERGAEVEDAATPTAKPAFLPERGIMRACKGVRW